MIPLVRVVKANNLDNCFILELFRQQGSLHLAFIKIVGGKNEKIKIFYGVNNSIMYVF